MITGIARLMGKDKARSSEAEQRLHSAYVQLFSGNGTSEDAELVFIDLMMVSEYHILPEEGCSDAMLREHNGKRSVGSRIAYMMDWSPETVRNVQEAVQAEMIAEAY